MQKKYKILVYLFLLITAATNASAQCAITITQQPVLPALVCVTPGTSETIAVTATINAGGSLTYQWYFNDNLIDVGVMFPSDGCQLATVVGDGIRLLDSGTRVKRQQRRFQFTDR